MVEAHAFLGEAVDVRCLDQGIAKAAWVGKAHVVDEDDDDDLTSITSSTFGSERGDADLVLEDVDGPGDSDDWCTLDDESRAIKIDKPLKSLT